MNGFNSCESFADNAARGGFQVVPCRALTKPQRNVDEDRDNGTRHCLLIEYTLEVTLYLSRVDGSTKQMGM